MGKFRDVYVIGVGMTKFARHPDRKFCDLGEEAEGGRQGAGGVEKRIDEPQAEQHVADHAVRGDAGRHEPDDDPTGSHGCLGSAH